MLDIFNFFSGDVIGRQGYEPNLVNIDVCLSSKTLSETFPKSPLAGESDHCLFCFEEIIDFKVSKMSGGSGNRNIKFSEHTVECGFKYTTSITLSLVSGSAFKFLSDCCNRSCPSV